jgi:2-polyprenyl-6-methoxyphenol hydroxylase-like FAD-dependent oxidoreductase
VEHHVVEGPSRGRGGVTVHVLVLGSGPTGLVTAAVLAERGHRVTSVDRDPGPLPGRSPEGESAWARRGVMQFRHAHGFRPQVTEVLQRRWPAGYAAWLEHGAEAVTVTVPDGGVVEIGRRSRRSTFERALRSAAARTPGVTLRTGHVDEVTVVDGRVTGALVDGDPVGADLVVDASGRSSRLGRSVEAELEGRCGLAYVDRTYRLRPGAEPGPMNNPIASFNELVGYQVLVFLHEAGHFSALFVRPTADEALKPLRHDRVFDAAARAVPALAGWTDPERAAPTSGVMVGGALRNVYRAQRRLPGLVTVGDAVATTTPTRGRGIAMALLQVDALVGLLDDGVPADALAEPFGAWCEASIRPWVEDHVAVDTETVARWQGAELETEGPLTSDRICDAAQVDTRIAPYAGAYQAMTALPSVLAPAEPLARAVYRTGWRAPYADGPTRDELVEVVAAAAR